jgi:PTH2 family peptidyl-tRNA hydrolase
MTSQTFSDESLHSLGYFAFGCVSMLIASRLFATVAAPASAPAAARSSSSGASDAQSPAENAKGTKNTTTTTTTTTNDDDDDDDDDDDELVDESLIANKASLLPSEHKMVLVVRNDLSMGKGKIGAQCGHATLGAYKRAVKRSPAAVASWSRWGQAKICVKVNSEAELLEIEQLANALKLPNYLVADAGRTQIEAGSLTVLAVGPAPVAQINQVTGHLKLL